MIGVEINGYQWASIGVNGHQLVLMGGIKWGISKVNWVESEEENEELRDEEARRHRWRNEQEYIAGSNLRAAWSDTT